VDLTAAMTGPLAPVAATVAAALPIRLPASLNSAQGLGIPLALAGAVFLSLGTQFQHAGVERLERAKSRGAAPIGGAQILQLGRTPSWVVGTLMLILAVGMQLASLRYASLIVVQPLGVIALVVTAILNARVTGVRLGRRTIRAIALCVVGVGVFVTAAAPIASDAPIPDGKLIAVLVITGVVLAGVWTILSRFRGRISPIGVIVAAGVQAGLVATMAKTVINRIIVTQFDVHQFNALTIVAGVVLILVTLSSVYTVQIAHTVGPPDLVIAGLTVIDPLMAVTIGIVVLGEAAGAPLWIVFVFLLAGAAAVFGVVQLARHHPQAHQ
jgi:hypothetical protein